MRKILLGSGLLAALLGMSGAMNGAERASSYSSSSAKGVSYQLPNPPAIKEGEEKSAGSSDTDLLDEENVAPVRLEEEIDSEANYRDFITRSEFEKEVSKLSWKKGPFTFTPYGFLWVNASWNSSRCVSDSFCLYVLSDEVDDTSSGSVDARTSRVGMMIDGPGFPGNSDITSKGVFEADFQGQTNVIRSKGQFQLRKAYVELKSESAETRALFGQDWDIISPLAPQMLNYLPAGFSGNIGYRRCQMKLEKGMTFSSNLQMLGQIGIADSLPGDYTTTTGVTAEGGSWPMLEGRYSVSLGKAARDNLPITLGFSGHVGEEIYRFSPIAGTKAKTSETKHIKTWSFNFDGDLPITKKFRLQGEYFYGQDLSTFCGGINQGVDLYRRDGIRSQGGWLAFHTQLTEKLTNNVGYSVDHPFEEDMEGTSVASNGVTNFRTQNESIFTNFLYQWNSALMTGVELGYWKTDYKRANVSTERVSYSDMEAGKAFRIDCAVQYLF